MDNDFNVKDIKILGVVESNESLIDLPVFNKLVSLIHYNHSIHKDLQTVNSKEDYLLIPVHNGNCKFEFTRGLSVTKFAKYIDPFESELDSIKYVAIESNK